MAQTPDAPSWNPRLATALHTAGRVVMTHLFGGTVDRVALADRDVVDIEWTPPAAFEGRLAVCYAGSMVELAYLEATAGISLDAADHLRDSTFADESEAHDLLAARHSVDDVDAATWLEAAVDRCRAQIDRAQFWDLVEPVALHLYRTGALDRARLDTFFAEGADDEEDEHEDDVEPSVRAPD